MAIDRNALADLRQRHRGDLITPEDAPYEEARRVWNAMIDRRPAIIARPRGAADVVECRAVRAADEFTRSRARRKR